MFWQVSSIYKKLRKGYNYKRLVHKLHENMNEVLKSRYFVQKRVNCNLFVTLKWLNEVTMCLKTCVVRGNFVTVCCKGGRYENK